MGWILICPSASVTRGFHLICTKLSVNAGFVHPKFAFFRHSAPCLCRQKGSCIPGVLWRESHSSWQSEMTAPKRRGKTGSILAKGGDAFSKEHHLQILQGTVELIHLAQPSQSSFQGRQTQLPATKLICTATNLPGKTQYKKLYLVLGSFDQFLRCPRVTIPRKSSGSYIRKCQGHRRNFKLSIQCTLKPIDSGYFLVIEKKRFRRYFICLIPTSALNSRVLFSFSPW